MIFWGSWFLYKYFLNIYSIKNFAPSPRPPQQTWMNFPNIFFHDSQVFSDNMENEFIWTARNYFGKQYMYMKLYIILCL